MAVSASEDRQRPWDMTSSVSDEVNVSAALPEPVRDGRHGNAVPCLLHARHYGREVNVSR